MSALYNFHKDLKLNIPNIEGLIENAKTMTGQSNYKKIAEAINLSMAFLADPEDDDDPNEELSNYIYSNYDEEELGKIYDYFDMLVGFIIKSTTNPDEAFDIALGFKPYDDEDGLYVQSPDGKKIA